MRRGLSPKVGYLPICLPTTVYTGLYLPICLPTTLGTPTAPYMPPYYPMYTLLRIEASHALKEA